MCIMPKVLRHKNGSVAELAECTGLENQSTCKGTGVRIPSLPQKKLHRLWWVKGICARVPYDRAD